MIATSTDLGFVRAVGPEEIIFDRGDRGSEFYVVLEGTVSIRTSARAETHLASLGPGEFFGEMAVVDQRPRSAGAVGGPEGAVLMAVDGARFVYLVSAQPGFAMLIMEKLSLMQRGPENFDELTTAWKEREHKYDIVPVGEDGFQFLSRSRSANAYLFKGPMRNILIDTGLPSAAPALHRAIADTGLSPGDIDMIVLTHEHFDHTGAVPSFSERPVVAAFGLAANKIRLNDEFATMSRAFNEIATPLDVDVEIAPGTVLDTGHRRFHVYHTPGHSSGGISLVSGDDGLLVSGDTVLKGGPIGGIFGSGNVSDLMYSLQQLHALRPQLLLPGHGPLSEAPLDDIDKTYARCGQLLGDSVRLFDSLNANQKVAAIVNAFRDLNRSFNRS